MNESLEMLEVAVLRLSPADRARLLDRLIASLDADDSRNASWDAEAARREEALANGTADEAPLDEVLDRLRAQLP